jgi:hypothetical protein
MDIAQGSGDGALIDKIKNHAHAILTNKLR